MSLVRCFELDFLAVQRSLAGLQDRYDDLHRTAQAQFVALVAERDVQTKEKLEAQQAVEELKQQLEAKGVELQKVVGERDARAKEKGEAQQAVEELKKQLETSQFENKEAREEIELILLQLHQVQEELEYHFLLARQQDELLSSYSDIQLRIAVFMSDLNNSRCFD
jgi:chromosome segregation ATPase